MFTKLKNNETVSVYHFLRSVWPRTASLRGGQAEQLRCRPSSSPSSSSLSLWEPCPWLHTLPGGTRMWPISTVHYINAQSNANNNFRHKLQSSFSFYPSLSPALQPDSLRGVWAFPETQQYLQCGWSLDRWAWGDLQLSLGRLDLPKYHQKWNILLFHHTHHLVSAYCRCCVCVCVCVCAACIVLKQIESTNKSKSTMRKNNHNLWLIMC